jgi:hypothetical protein
MIFVRYKSGRTLQGILLALGDQSIRLAIQGSDDAAVYRLVSGQWVSEDCEVVTFDFADEGYDLRDKTGVREPIFSAPSERSTLYRVM